MEAMEVVEGRIEICGNKQLLYRTNSHRTQALGTLVLEEAKNAQVWEL